jgi:hypothetical protein
MKLYGKQGYDAPLGEMPQLLVYTFVVGGGAMLFGVVKHLVVTYLLIQVHFIFRVFSCLRQIFDIFILQCIGRQYLGFLFKEGMLDSGSLCLEINKFYITSSLVGHLTFSCRRDGPKTLLFVPSILYSER